MAALFTAVAGSRVHVFITLAPRIYISKLAFKMVCRNPICTANKFPFPERSRNKKIALWCWNIPELAFNWLLPVPVWMGYSLQQFLFSFHTIVWLCKLWSWKTGEKWPSALTVKLPNPSHLPLPSWSGNWLIKDWFRNARATLAYWEPLINQSEWMKIKEKIALESLSNEMCSQWHHLDSLCFKLCPID